MAKVNRFASNGGEISPDLHPRADLASIHSSLREASNVIIEQHGPATRRPGTEVVQKLDQRWQHPGGIPQPEPPPPGSEPDSVGREFIMEVDASKFFYVNLSIDITGNVYFDIHNSDGLHIERIEPEYSWQDIDRIHIEGSYDVLFFFHPSYQTKRLERWSDTDWRWVNQQYIGGPIGYVNTDRAAMISTVVPIYDSLETYGLGAHVIKKTPDPLTGVTTNRLWTMQLEDGHLKKTYVTLLKYSPSPPVNNTPQRGDTVKVFGGSALAGTWKTEGVTLDGLGTYYLTLVTNTTQIDDGPLENDFSGIDVSGHNAYPISSDLSNETYYMSIVSNNLGNDPATSPDEWAQVTNITGNLDLFSPADVFLASDVGKLIRFVNPNRTSLSGSFGVSGQGLASESIPAVGSIVMRTEGGIWGGVLALEVSYDQGTTWEEIGNITSNQGEHNGEIIRDCQTFGAIARARMKKRFGVTGDSGCVWSLEITGTQYVYCEITEVTDANNAAAIISGSMSTYFSTWQWSTGAIGGADGYPGACRITDEQRLAISGIPGHPGRIWWSAVDDWNNWQEMDLETASFSITLAAGARNNVMSLANLDGLVALTDSAEYVIGTRNKDQITSAANIDVKLRSNNGSNSTQAIICNDRLVYIDSTGKMMHAIFYSWEADGFQSQQLMVKARHLTDGKTIKHMAYIRNPNPSIWAVLSDGTMAVYTFNQAENVAAWSTIAIPNIIILDIAVTPSADGESLSLMVTHPGTAEKYILKMQPGNVNFDRSYTITDQLPICIQSAGNYKILDETYNERTGLVKTDNFIAILDEEIETLVLKHLGTVIADGEDYYIHESGLVCLGTDLSPADITVFGGLVELTEDVDWKHIDTPVFLTITNPDILELELTWEIDGTPAVEGTTQFTIKPGLIIFDAAENEDIAGFNGITPLELLTDFVYDFFDALINPDYVDLNDAIYIGFEYETIIAPTDLTFHPDLGGPGGNVKISHIDLYLYSSMGGEVSTDDGEEYWPIQYMPPTTTPGEALPEFTGKIEIPTAEGWTNDGALVKIRTSSPRNFRLAALGINVSRNSGVR